MDGDNGFCGSVLGTKIYGQFTQSMVPVLKHSKCHTLDRDDMRAQRDVCGVGHVDEWTRAVELQYKVNHWPYINAKVDTAQCFSRTLRDSPENLAKDAAHAQKILLSILSLFLVILHV